MKEIEFLIVACVFFAIGLFIGYNIIKSKYKTKKSIVSGIDTSGFKVGDKLYTDPNKPGAIIAIPDGNLFWNEELKTYQIFNDPAKVVCQVGKIKPAHHKYHEEIEIIDNDINNHLEKDGYKEGID